MTIRHVAGALLVAFTLGACGGGADEAADKPQASQAVQAAPGAQGAQAAQAAQARRSIARAVAAADAHHPPPGPAPWPAPATALFDFAEAHFPQFFPSHEADQSVESWRYRFYPQTGIYLVVADGKVYVLGGPFGPQVLYVGQAADILNPPPNAVAAVSTPATGKTAWNIATPASFTMTDTAGLAVAGPFACSSDAPQALEVAADCSTLTGRRLGLQTITVSRGGLVAKATIKVIPQPQPLGTNMHARYNLVATPDGRVLAWGDNAGGVLGQGKFSSQLASSSLPVAVQAASGQGALQGIVAVSAGESVALALSEDGEVYSWGYGDALGRQNQNGDARPGQVLDPTGHAPLRRIVAVSVGDDNAVALADDGSVFAWGPWAGKSGITTMKVPVAVDLPAPAVAVAAGWNWSAALLGSGRMMTWGSNGNDGKVGQGHTNDVLSPAPVRDAATGLPLEGIVAMAPGYRHGLALTSTGQAYAWGHNESNQIGQNSDTASYRSAVPVKAPNGTAGWTGLTAVVAGGNFSLALDQAGRVFSWGYSQNGELGDGANHPRVNESGLPAAVVGEAGFGQLSGIVAIAAGYDQGLALAGDGRLFVWGSGFRGRLGQGGTGTAESYVPLLVKDESGTAPLNLGPASHWPNPLRRGLF